MNPVSEYTRYMATRPPTIPPAGCVDFSFDRDLGTMAWLDSDGVKHPTTDQAALATKRTKAGVLVVTAPDGTQQEFAPVANTDVARFNAWVSANSALITGGSLYVPPGNYYVATSRQMLKSARYTFDRCRFYINSSTAPGEAGTRGNWTFWLTTLSGLTIDGQLTIDGGGIAGKEGLVIQDCPGSTISNVTFQNHAAHALWIAPSAGTFQPPTAWNNITCINNTGTGFYIPSYGEYHIFTGCRTKNNGLGWFVAGGNNYFIGCVSTADTSGITIGAGPNNAHGCWIGGSVNHSITKGLKIESGVNLGFRFVGTSFFANAAGGIDLGGAGVGFDNCIVDSAITCSSAQEGIHTFNNCLMPLSATVLTSLTAPQRANIRFYNCKTNTGDFSGNESALAVATPASASATGNAGQVATDASYIYVCTATNTWKRAAITTW